MLLKSIGYNKLLALQLTNVYRYAAGKRNYSSSAREPKPFSSIPGLKSLPIIGPLHHFLPGIDISAYSGSASECDHIKSAWVEISGEFGKVNMFDATGIFFEKFGPMVKLDGIFSRASMVILFEPEHIDQVYRSQESNPLRPGFETLTYYREVLHKSTFDGIYGLTTAQGPKWRDIRTKVNPALLKIKLVRVYAPGLEDIANEMVVRLNQLRNQDQYIKNNLLLEMNKWALESVAYVGLGARLDCLNDDLAEDHPARQLMQCSKDIIESAFDLEFLPNPWKYIATPGYKKIIKTFDTQWKISQMYIGQARKRIEERGQDIPEEDKSIIEKLLAIDEIVATMMANEMLLAGIDTVSFAALSVLYHLAANPEKQDILRQEIRSDDPHKRYLRACLKEALRIWHVVPSNLRRTDKDHIVGGYHIPKGVDVIAPNEFLPRLEKYYPRPNEFIPERWLADKGDPLYYGNAHPMVTLPFGFGVRSCIGRRIAELEIEILMKKLIDEFKVTWDGPPIKVVNKFTNSFVAPFNFNFQVAK